MYAANESAFDGCRPILCVDSVPRSIAYYVDTLGFRLGWAWSNEEQRFLDHGVRDGAGFAMVGRGPAQFMLSEKSQGIPGMWLHIDVHSAEQLDELHADWLNNGALLLEPPTLRPWGMYEMRVRDPDSHVLRVSAQPRRER